MSYHIYQAANPPINGNPRALSRVALYGLLLFYGLVRDELAGRRPLAKFLAIKLIVMATFYQSFVVRRNSTCILCRHILSELTLELAVQCTRGTGHQTDSILDSH